MGGLHAGQLCTHRITYDAFVSDRRRVPQYRCGPGVQAWLGGGARVDGPPRRGRCVMQRQQQPV